jgi:PAS domain S-box-containing protein
MLVLCIGLTCGYKAGSLIHEKFQYSEAKDAVENLSHHLASTSLVPTMQAASPLAVHKTIIDSATGRLAVDDTEVLNLLNISRFLLEASLVYVLDRKGLVVACTPYGVDGKKTLTGNNYSFRPYFKDAMRNSKQIIYAALGVTTGKRGIYISNQIRDEDSAVGVLVIKMEVGTIDETLANMEYPNAWYSPDGIIFASNNPEWLYKTLLPIEPNHLKALRESKQFANEPLNPLGLNIDTQLIERDGNRYFIATANTHINGWKAFVLKPESQHIPLLWGCIVIGGSLALLLFYTATSVVARRQSKRLLREQGQRLELALAGGGLGTWDWYLPSDRVVFDKRWTEMKGYEFGEIEPTIETWKKLVHPDDLPEVYEKLENHFNNKTDSYEAICRIRHKNGRWLWILDRGKVVEWDAEHKPIRVCGTHLDITSQKKLEQDIREEHEKLLSILDSAPVGVVIVDKKRVIRWVNRFALQLSGLDEKEKVLGKQCGDYFCPAEQAACPVLDLGQNVDNSERIFRNIAGKEYPIIKTVKELDFEGDECFLEIFIDITERKHLEIELTQAQKLKSVGRLAAGIAHEINTPIQYVETNIAFLGDSFQDIANLLEKFCLLQKKTKENPELQEENISVQAALDKADWDYLSEEIPSAVQQAKEGTRRVATIVQAMKEFSHPSSKEKQPADLHKIISNTIIVCQGEWKNLADLETDFSENLPPVPCILDEIGQVILNIVVNAAHAIGDKFGANPDGRKGLIKIQTTAGDDTAEIRIEDNGLGIPDTIKDQIFDPFFTTKEVGRGSGQGLAIAHDVVVNKHGGSISVNSSPGAGATFILQLPLTARSH